MFSHLSLTIYSRCLRKSNVTQRGSLYFFKDFVDFFPTQLLLPQTSFSNIGLQQIKQAFVLLVFSLLKSPINLEKLVRLFSFGNKALTNSKTSLKKR